MVLQIYAKKKLRYGCGTQSGPGTGPGAGGAEGRGRGAGVFIKARNAHPRPGSRLPRRARAGSAIYQLFPSHARPRLPLGHAFDGGIFRVGFFGFGSTLIDAHTLPGQTEGLKGCVRYGRIGRRREK
jgi:hypothetical protein